MKTPRGSQGLVLASALTLVACGDEGSGASGGGGSDSDAETGSDGGTGGGTDDASGGGTAGGSSGMATGGEELIRVSLSSSAPALGEVTLNGQDCDPVCELQVVPGETVTLSVIPKGPYFSLEGWTVTAGAEPDCADPGACEQVIDEETVLVANFESAHNLVFTTPGDYTGAEIGGLEGADAICNQAAADAGLPGTQWVAWLSTTTTNAVDRMGDARGFVRLDGLPVADTLADILEGRMLTPIATDTSGAATWRQLWTSTRPDGTYGSDRRSMVGNCDDWTSEVGTAVQGSSVGTGTEWTDWTELECSFATGFYCFEVDHTDPLVVEPATGRRAFVSNTLFSSGPGIADADSICSSEGAVLGGSFKALIGTSTASAVSRFDLTGEPWVRVDGIPWVRDPMDLVGDAALTALNVTADGMYLSGPAEIEGTSVPEPFWALTGGPLGEMPEALAVCQDWSIGEQDMDAYMLMGNIQQGYDNVASCCSGPCTNSGHVYCLEE